MRDRIMQAEREELTQLRARVKELEAITGLPMRIENGVIYDPGFTARDALAKIRS